MTPEEIRSSLESSLITAANTPTAYLTQNVQSPVDLSHSHSINTIPSVSNYIISEDVLAGQRLNGRMSNIRRFFCLFVTFDLLFISLMWTICVMLNGQNIVNALSIQILHYDIHTSLFDVVLVAMCRFVVLIFFYAVIYINHWIVIALSTALTCAFLIAKVFIYDWPHSSQPIFEVLLVLVSFILCWGEAWFLDFRVLPQESEASRYRFTSESLISERTPLIRSYVQGLPSQYTESVGNFYSPLASPEGSLHRVDPIGRPNPPFRISKEQEDIYRHTAENSLDCAWDLLQKNDWKLTKQVGDDTVYIRVDKDYGKIFKLNAQIDVSPKFLLDELYFRVHEFANWNSSVLESQKIQAIDEHTDVCYHVAVGGAGGLISSRDFVTLRHWSYFDGAYLIASVKTEHPSFPKCKKFVRAENGVGCYLLEPDPTDANKTNMIWVLNTNLNIFIPKQVIEKELIKTMFTTMKDLRQHVQSKSMPT